MVVLRTPVRLQAKDFTTISDFTVSADQMIPFVLTYSASHLSPPAPIDARKALVDAESFWRHWISRCASAGKWSADVRRSLITLKASTYRPTGGIVAAPTTSLPEQLGGSRNWDDRFCWLRDATFTLLALMNSGYYEEARSWQAWLLRAVAGEPSQVQITYGLLGERRLTEWEIPWLPGYEGSKPVRIGNATTHLQLDIFGAVMDAFYQGRKGKVAVEEHAWAVQRALLDHLETIWDQPDEGMWEIRGGRQQFTYSKMMAWVAFDRAIKGAEDFDLAGPIERWRALRGTIHEEICTHAFDRRIGAFVQSYGSKNLDASLLLIPAVGFLPPDDPRVQSTIAAVEQHLLADGLVPRYGTADTRDGLPPGEGVFLACSFWLADNLLATGRREEAQQLFERLLGLRNDVGLLSEEYDPQTKRLVGNFPHALSHIALVNTAHNLTRSKKAMWQRSGHTSRASGQTNGVQIEQLPAPLSRKSRIRVHTAQALLVDEPLEVAIYLKPRDRKSRHPTRPCSLSSLTGFTCSYSCDSG